MKKFLLSLIGILAFSLSWAQNVTVYGYVVDSIGDPIPGAKVIEKGKPQNGTVTDPNGYFTLSVPANAHIVASYIGYSSQEKIAVTGSPMHFVLSFDPGMDRSLPVTECAKDQEGLSKSEPD